SSPWYSASASTRTVWLNSASLTPPPTPDHARPSQRAMRLTISPPDSLNVPPATSALSYTIRLSTPMPPSRPAPSGAHASPSQLAMLLAALPPAVSKRSEEHTSELQSREKVECRLLLEEKKTPQ